MIHTENRNDASRWPRWFLRGLKNIDNALGMRESFSRV